HVSFHHRADRARDDLRARGAPTADAVDRSLVSGVSSGGTAGGRAVDFCCILAVGRRCRVVVGAAAGARPVARGGLGCEGVGVWPGGQGAGGRAEKGRELYGARNEEFIESVKAFAYFPIAVYKGIDNFENGEISVRFQIVGGALDRCAGFLFNVKPNGDYLTV